MHIYIHVLKKKKLYLFELDLCLYRGVLTPPHSRDIAPRFCVHFGYHAVMTCLGDDATSAGFDVGFCRS